MEMIRLAVVGLGHRGRLMIKLAHDGFQNLKVVAACDCDPLLWTEKQHLIDRPMKDVLPEAKFYTSYDQMLEEMGHEIDMVLVETGADCHAEFCMKALKRDIHVFSDIPSVATLKEAKELYEAEKASKAMVMTGANANETFYSNAMLDLYKRGLLGEMIYMEAEYIGGSMRSIPRSENPILNHSPWRSVVPGIRYCTHSLGPLLRLMREVLRYTYCIGTNAHVEPDRPGDDVQSAFFQTESGVAIRLLRSGRCDGGLVSNFGHHSYRGWGTKGYFEMVGDRGPKNPMCFRFQSKELYCGQDLIEVPSKYMPNEYSHMEVAKVGHGGCDYAVLDKAFQTLWKDLDEFPITLKDGLAMTIPGIYAAKSAAQGGMKMTIRYPWEEGFDEDIANVDSMPDIKCKK